MPRSDHSLVTCCPSTDDSAAARPRSAPSSSTHLDRTRRRILGTSHRQAPVKDLVGRVRAGPRRPVPRSRTATRSSSATAARPRSGMPQPSASSRRRSQNLVFGEFGAQVRRRRGRPVARGARRASTRPAGSRSEVEVVDGVDVYAWPHNETSTGVMAPVTRVHGDDGALTVIDATSAAGGIDFDAAETDVYYFAPQKNLASDGGLWFALVSPAAIERDRARSPRSGRYIPEFLSLKNALDNSRLNQTLNTPALVDPAAAGEPARLDQRQRRPRAGPTPARASRRRRPLRLGRARRLRDARSSPTPPTARRSSSRSTSTTRSTPRPSRRPCAPTASSTPSRTASSAATSCASRRSRRSSRTTCARSSRSIDYVVEPARPIRRRGPHALLVERQRAAARSAARPHRRPQGRARRTVAWLIASVLGAAALRARSLGERLVALVR